VRRAQTKDDVVWSEWISVSPGRLRVRFRGRWGRYFSDQLKAAAVRKQILTEEEASVWVPGPRWH